MKIRHATENDLEELDTVFRGSISRLCSKDYPAAVIASWVDSVPVEARRTAVEKKNIWVAELDSKIAGYMVAIPGEIIALFVSPNYVGKGVGKSLGEYALNIAKDNTVGKVVVESTLTAESFYQKLGFKTVSTGHFSHGSSQLEIEVRNMEYSCNGS